MNINTRNMEKPEMNLPYEPPSLKKYGTMKEFTLGSGGSGGDGMGSDIKNDPGLGDITRPGIGGGTLNDDNDFFGNTSGDPADAD